jgi:hypothetical protein
MATDTASSLSHSFSIAKDGKHHDATFSVEGDVLSVIYWGPEGVTLRRCPAAQAPEPEVAARTLLNEMI